MTEREYLNIIRVEYSDDSYLANVDKKIWVENVESRYSLGPEMQSKSQASTREIDYLECFDGFILSCTP